MVKPVTLACGHSSCHNCIETLIIMESAPKCPLCKRVFHSGSALNVNIVLNDLTAKLDIQCTNSGCHWQGKLEDHSQHSSTCGKLPVECVNNGCREVILRDELALHNSRCEKKEVPCQECGRSVTRDSMQEHVDSLCSHKRIPCPLSCGTNLPRCHVTLHASECPEKAVQCTVNGCNTIVKRKNVQEHIMTAASTHAVLQAGEVQKLRGLMHFKRAKPTWILQEKSVFSFRWKASDWKNLQESVMSTDYRCPNGNRWRGLFTFKGGQLYLSLQLVSSVTPVIVGARIVLMPGTASEKIFTFEARPVEEGQVIGNIPSEDFFGIIPDGIMTCKFVMSYYILKEK